MILTGPYHFVYKSRAQVFRHYNMGDLHHLSRGSCTDAIRRDVKYIAADPHATVTLTGDLIDAIGYKDARFNPAQLDPSLTIEDLGDLGFIAMDQIADILSPIRGKILGIHTGNHELSLMRSTQSHSLYHRLCRKLDAERFGYSALYDLIFHRRPRAKFVGPVAADHRYAKHGGDNFRVRVYSTHGTSGATTTAGKMRVLRKMMDRWCDADVVLMGHVHELMSLPVPRMCGGRSCASLTERIQVGAICGSYLRTYSIGEDPSYGEMRQYDPTMMGMACVTIAPDKRAVSVGQAHSQPM